MDRLGELYHFLEGVTEEERINLQAIIGSSFGSSPNYLCDQFIYLRDGAIEQILSQRSYKQLVTDVADHVCVDWNSLCKVNSWDELTSSEIENAVVIKIFTEV